MTMGFDISILDSDDANTGLTTYIASRTKTRVVLVVPALTTTAVGVAQLIVTCSSGRSTNRLITVGTVPS